MSDVISIQRETFGRAARVLLVTSDREQCGIRTYGQLLIEHVAPEAAVIVEHPYCHPGTVFDLCAQCGGKSGRPRFDVVHLNHHAGLHSQWESRDIRSLQRLGFKVVVTQHDTFEDWKIMQDRGMLDATDADALFVHERVEGLRQVARRFFHLPQPVPTVRQGVRANLPFAPSRPTLGLVGFDFPWKNFEVAAAAAGVAGWDLAVAAPNLPRGRQEDLWGILREGTPDANLYRFPWEDDLSQLVLGLNLTCSATAFLYTNGNSGTSSAIRIGIAAKRPVVAYRGTCRQLRDLEGDPVASQAICWVDPGESPVREVAEMLHQLRPGGKAWSSFATEKTILTKALAGRDSWDQAGLIYGTIYRALAVEGHGGRA